VLHESLGVLPAKLQSAKTLGGLGEIREELGRVRVNVARLALTVLGVADIDIVAGSKQLRVSARELLKIIQCEFPAAFESGLRALGAEDGAERFSIKNVAKEAVHGALLIRVEAGTVRFQEVGRIDGGIEKTVAFDGKNGTTLKVLGDAMVHSLIEAGLFEKEARAMVKTWTNDWFGDVGTRILYIAPTNFADELLPLKVEPKPTAVARVLVGRHDILTPEQERELDTAVKKLHDLRAEYEAASARFSAAGDALEKKLGRFRWPAQGAAEARLKLAR
jgi:hypothetical protein